MQIQDQSIGEVISHFKYLAYGFGGACGVILFLLGVICKLVSKYVGAKIKQTDDDRKQAEADRQHISELTKQIALIQQDLDGLKDHELARSSFSRGLYAVSEKLSGVKIEFDHIKDELKELRWKCERRHVPHATEDDEG